jgi:hypothetical protein
MTRIAPTCSCFKLGARESDGVQIHFFHLKNNTIATHTPAIKVREVMKPAVLSLLTPARRRVDAESSRPWGFK